MASNNPLLAEAEAALHKLVTGARVVGITRDGKRVEFQQSGIAELERHIQKLKGTRTALRVSL